MANFGLGNALNNASQNYDQQIDLRRRRIFDDQQANRAQEQHDLYRRNADQQYTEGQYRVNALARNEEDAGRARTVSDNIMRFQSNPQDVAALNETMKMAGVPFSFTYNGDGTYNQVFPDGRVTPGPKDAAQAAAMMQFVGENAEQRFKRLDRQQAAQAEAKKLEDARAHERDMSSIDYQRRAKDARDIEGIRLKNALAVEDARAQHNLNKGYQDSALNVWEAQNKPFSGSAMSSELQGINAVAQNMPIIPGETQDQRWMRAYEKFMQDKHSNGMMHFSMSPMDARKQAIKEAAQRDPFGPNFIFPSRAEKAYGPNGQDDWIERRTQEILRQSNQNEYQQQPVPSDMTLEQAQSAPRFQEGQTKYNPQTKQRIIFEGGRWRPM